MSKQTLKSLGTTLVFIWLGCVVYVLLEQVSGALTYREFEIDPIRRLHAITVYYWLPWLLMAPLVALLSARFPIRPAAWLVPIAAHIVLLLALSLVQGLVVGYIYHYSPNITEFMSTFEPWQHSGHFLFGDDMFLFGVVFYLAIAASLNIESFMQIVRQQEIDAGKLNKSLAELRFQTLRMQINPHFIFNALNAISVLVGKKETERANEMIHRLSRLFRKTLDESSTHWVSLDDELDTVRQYLAIARVRFGDRLTVDERCDPDVLGICVPSMLLQPLVENAVTHGLAERVGQCEISVHCKRSGDRLRIEIRDNGIGGRFYEHPGFKEGIGLANVRARLEQMYTGKHAFSLESEPGRGTCVSITVPIEVPLSLRVAV